MRTTGWTGRSSCMAAASQARPTLLQLRRGNAGLRARHSEQCSPRIDAQRGIQPLLLGAFERRPGALHVDFPGALGRIGEHANMVFQHLDETLVDGEIPLLAVRHGNIRQRADAEQPPKPGRGPRSPQEPASTPLTEQRRPPNSLLFPNTTPFRSPSGEERSRFLPDATKTQITLPLPKVHSSRA